MKWSVLDQSPVSEGRGEDQAIRDSLVLAQDCDRLGYERFWLSEHHALASVAGTAPEVLAAAVAATTRRIRVGSAGVMLPHYSALKVAEQFRVLEAIAPGRIDLLPETHPYRGITTHPTGATSPPLWILGSSSYVINTWTYDPEARRHSYALLAEAFELHAGCE